MFLWGFFHPHSTREFERESEALTKTGAVARSLARSFFHLSRCRRELCTHPAARRKGKGKTKAKAAPVIPRRGSVNMINISRWKDGVCFCCGATYGGRVSVPESLFRVVFVCMCTVMSASSSVDYDLSIIHRLIPLPTNLFGDGKTDDTDLLWSAHIVHGPMKEYSLYRML